MQENLNSKEAKLKIDCPKNLPDSLKHLPLENITNQELEQIKGGNSDTTAYDLQDVVF